MTTPQKDMPPPGNVAAIAAGGTTISLGTGMMELSMAMRTTTPQYPHC